MNEWAATEKKTNRKASNGLKRRTQRNKWKSKCTETDKYNSDSGGDKDEATVIENSTW